jgi:hypothetical protein
MVQCSSSNQKVLQVAKTARVVQLVQQAPAGAALAVMHQGTGLQLLMLQQHHQDSTVAAQPLPYLSLSSRTTAAVQLLQLLTAGRTSSRLLMPTPAVLPSAQA